MSRTRAEQVAVAFVWGMVLAGAVSAWMLLWWFVFTPLSRTDFAQEWWHIVTDPAHAAAEVTFMLVADVLFAMILWPLIKVALKRAVKREHNKIDAEHGVENHGRTDA